MPHAHEDLIADQLLSQALERIQASGAENVIAVGSPTRYSFYLGMAPGMGLWEWWLGTADCNDG